MSKNLEARKKRAYELHAQIVLGAKKIFNSWIEIGLALKEIKDQQYYKELGYSSFRNYVENEFHKDESTAYRYIQGVKKIPPKILANLQVSNAEIPALFKILALPGDPEFIQNLTESDLQELAEMSDADFKKEVQSWKTRYQKQYRRAEMLDQEKRALEAEKEDLLNQIKTLSHDLSVAKTQEDDKKLLKLQQELDNWKLKYNQLEEKAAELEAQHLTEEQALAICNKAFDQILNALFALKKIDLCPAIIPQVYGLYTLARDMIDAEMTYLCQKTDITEGPLTLRDLAKDVEQHERGEPFLKSDATKDTG